MTPYYEHGGITIYHGDCRDVLPSIAQADAMITDPPYGCGLSVDYAKRFKPGVGDWWNRLDRSGNPRHVALHGDSEPFDPAHLLAFGAPAKVLWGGNWFANRLPESGGWWVWDKRNGRRDVSEADWPMGEGEIAWANIGKGVRIFRHTWFGLIRDSEPGSHLHPTQKPVALMAWCIEQAKVPAGGLIVDPYCGSGPTLRAAKDSGRRAIGVEIEEHYCEKAAKRLSQEVLFA